MAVVVSLELLMRGWLLTLRTVAAGDDVACEGSGKSWAPYCGRRHQAPLTWLAPQ